jgi:hypothetical protein
VFIEGKEYITGLNREPHADRRFKSHLYRGTFGDPGMPMCWRGWNRDGGTAYSIWRNNVGLGVCQDCKRRAYAGLPPVQPKEVS